MKINFGFKKCSSFLNSWQPVEGYTTETIRDDFKLSQNILEKIKDRSIPAGSKWQQYVGYVSIRLFDILGKEQNYYVLSVTEIKRNEKTERFYPETYIDVFDTEGMNFLKNEGSSRLINLIHQQLDRNFQPVEDQVSMPKFINHRFYTFASPGCSEEKSNSDQCLKERLKNWHYIELFLLKNALDQWDSDNKQSFVSLATLSTGQDNFDFFTKIGLPNAYDLSVKKPVITEYVECSPSRNRNKALELKVITKSEIQKKRFLNFLSTKVEIPRLAIPILLVLSFLGGIFAKQFFFLLAHHFF